MPVDVPLSPGQLEELASTYGTPYQLYSEPHIRNNAKNLLQTFRRHFPTFTEFYAVKALPNPAILRILLEEGCGLDCSSAAELHIASVLGVPGEKVMFTSNYTSKKDLGIAFDQGVIINFDDVSLVDSLVEIRGRCPELVSFRLNPDLGRTDSETKSNVLGGPDAKFGVPLSQIEEAYTKAKAHGAKRFGMHMMTGSCVLNNEYWSETVSVLLDTVARIHKKLGINFEFINIGGGLGIPYRKDQSVVDVAALASQLRTVVSEKCTQHSLPFEPHLSMENGRYMTGPFGWLVSRCEVIKQIPQARYYGLDACMSNLMRPGMYNSYHYISVPARDNSADRHAANVVGTLCENNDWFAKRRDLPDSRVGDLFVIYDTGAHSHSMGFQYNGKLRAPEILLRSDGTTQLIREREDLHCLFDNTLVPADLVPAGGFPYNGRVVRRGKHLETHAAKAYTGAAAYPRIQSSIPWCTVGISAAAAIGGALLTYAWYSLRRAK